MLYIKEPLRNISKEIQRNIFQGRCVMESKSLDKLIPLAKSVNLNCALLNVRCALLYYFVILYI